MPLQMDSTVHYIVQKRGARGHDRRRARHKSPYNTYYVEGLPPGPIGNPGRRLDHAAARPTPGPWLYFVAVNPDTGETRFATDAAGHRANEKLSTPGARRTRRGAERGDTGRGRGAAAPGPRCCLLGSPIAHSLSPGAAPRRLRRLGLTTGPTPPSEVREAGSPASSAGLGPEWAGLSLTMPLKEAAFAVADEVSPLARRGRGRQHPGAYARRRVVGDNTDVHGMTRALQERARRTRVGDVGARARPRLGCHRALGGRVAGRARRASGSPSRCAAPPGPKPLRRRASRGMGVQECGLGELPAVLPEVSLVVSTLPGGAAPVGVLGDAPDLAGRVLLDVVYAGWPTPLAQAFEEAGDGSCRDSRCCCTRQRGRWSS